MTEQMGVSDLDFENVRPINLETEALKPGSRATPMSALIYAAVAGDMETAEEQITDDIEWGLMPYNKVLRGKPQVLSILRAGSKDQKRPIAITNVASKDWGVFEYWNIGTVSEELIKYGNEHHWPWPREDSNSLIGQKYRVVQCFVYHITADGKIDFMRQYLDVGSVWTQFK